MHRTLKKLPKSEAVLTIALEPQEFTKFSTQAFADFSRELKVPGFRPGHIPHEVVEAKVGKEAIRKHAVSLAIPEIVAQAIREEKLPVVARPDVKITAEEPLTFEVRVALLPDVKIKDYKSLTIPKRPIAVTEEEVEGEMHRIQKAYATFTPKDAKAEKGNRVEIDFEGFDEKNVSLENLKSKNHPLILGEEMLIPGFEEQLVGMKKGDTKEFDLTFPKNHPQEKWRNKKVHFKVVMQQVSEVQLPEWTPEFLEKVTSEKKTKETLRAEIADAFLREKVRAEEERRENTLIEELLKRATIELPEALIRDEIDFLKEETKLKLEKQGIPWERYEKVAKERGRDVAKELRQEATRRLTARRLIDHLLEEEKVTVDQTEIDKEMSRILQGKSPRDLGVDPQELFARITHTLKVRRLFSQFLPN